MLNQFSTTLQQSGEGNLGLQERLEMVKKKISSFCFLTMAERFQPNKHDKSTEIEKDRAQRQIRNLIMMHKIIHNAIEIVLSFLSNRSRPTECILFWQIHGHGNLFVPATGGLWDYLLIDISNTHELVSFKTKIGRH